MKKIAYVSPEIEVVELNLKATLLTISDGAGSSTPGTDDPEGI